MKKIQIFIYILFILHLFFLLIDCEEVQNPDNITNPENLEEKNNTLEENTEEENSTKEEEEENDNVDNADAGFFITDNIFDEKLKQILDERNLKPKKKITKQQLRFIFEIIYKTEKKAGEIKPEDIDVDINPEEHSKQFMDSVFNEVTKSLDYDDKIRVKEIKEWINPTRVQKAYLELLQGLAENIDYL